MMHVTVRTPKVLLLLVWPPPLSLATTRGISVDFFSSGYLDVSVPRVPYVSLWIHDTLHDSSPCGFPHSEICGSKLICSSPQLIAACHVLRRLLMPRHSPYALVRLNFLYISYTLVLFELSEFLAELSLSRTFVQDLLTLFRCEKTFYRLLHFVLSLRFRAFHLAVKLYFPFRLERLIYLLRLFVLFCSFSTQNTFFYSIVKDLLHLSPDAGRSGWTRTIDLALIRRAL